MALCFKSEINFFMRWFMNQKWQFADKLIFELTSAQQFLERLRLRKNKVRCV